MSEGTQKRISLASIRENPVALRGVNRQHADWIGLVDSVKSRGVINPIVVRELRGESGEVFYGLVDGLHRYTASMEAGLKDIPVHIMNMSDADTMEVQLIGNIHKIETQPAQYTKQLQKILSMSPLLSMTQLALKLNRSTTWITDRLSLSKLLEGVQKLVDDGKINLSNAYMLAKLPEEEQPNFVDRAMSMTPQEFTPTVQNRKKELDTARRQGRDPKAAEFTPAPSLQRLGTLKDELDAPKVTTDLIKRLGLKTAEEGAKLALQWVLHLDADSVAAAKAKDDVRKKVAEEQRIKAAAERAQQKAKDAAEAAAKLQTA